MAVYLYCTKCKDRAVSCAAESSHRADRSISYRADFMVGGRYGQRIRKTFATKKDAEAFEYITLADYARGTFLPQERSKVLFEDFFEAYLEKYVRRYMRGFETEIYRLRAFKQQFEKRPLHTIGVKEFDEYLIQREKDGAAKTTLNREITSLKTMFKWATDNGYIKASPFKSIKKFKVENIRVRWLDDNELAYIMDVCLKVGDPDMRDILLFAWQTGFRKANLERVTAHDIVGQRVQATRTKSGKPYDVPISRDLATLLARLIQLRPSGPLLNFSNFRRRFKVVNPWSDVSLHTFRHTFAAQCLKRGIELDVVCKWMGHYSIEFTRSHYGHLCPKREESLINLLSTPKKSDTARHFVDTPLTP